MKKTASADKDAIAATFSISFRCFIYQPLLCVLRYALSQALRVHPR
jgi:hypothetical protein